MTATLHSVPIGRQVARLDRWLETMRGPQGYGGPVVHWWRDCLLFCRAGLDWRYEGIIAGYLSLFERTGDWLWLQKAQLAGDDLVNGQLPNGNFCNSRFELNPGSGGTPHEAAADTGLLRLAAVLRTNGNDDWRTYLEAAQRNLQAFYLSRLWSVTERRFWDDEHQPSCVPNKCATLIEALCLLADLTGQEEYLHHYVRPTADAILEHQVRMSGSPLDGGIAQNSIGAAIVAKYFPYYVARCVPGLLAAHEQLADHRYLDAACAAASFVLRWREPDGAFPQVIYGNGRVNRYPRWVAAVADILRAFEMLRPYGFDVDVEPTRRWLIAGQLSNGAFKSAEGFRSQVSQRTHGGPPDVRDLIPVVGWNDKAFRYLASEVTSGIGEASDATPSDYGSVNEADVWFGGRRGRLRETDGVLMVQGQKAPIYEWKKGETWAWIAPM